MKFNYGCFSPRGNNDGFHHMARLMDSLILDPFAPFALTKISSVRPTKTNPFAKKTQTKPEPVRAFHNSTQQTSPVHSHQSAQTGKYKGRYDQ